jgi:hypothetical protein
VHFNLQIKTYEGEKVVIYKIGPKSVKVRATVKLPNAPGRTIYGAATPLHYFISTVKPVIVSQNTVIPAATQKRNKVNLFVILQERLQNLFCN